MRALFFVLVLVLAGYMALAVHQLLRSPNTDPQPPMPRMKVEFPAGLGISQETPKPMLIK